nr:hypothetical protein [Tanacetum cinerariifolium]
MENTMFDLDKICHHKQFLCIHDDVDDLIESALDFKRFLINSNSQRLDKKEQEVKNVVEQPSKRGNRREADLFLSDNSIPPGIENVVDDPEGDDYPPEIEVILCRIYVRFPRSSYPLIDFSLGKSISF